MKSRCLSLVFSLSAFAGAFAAESGPRIFLIYDMEGVSGIDRESMTGRVSSENTVDPLADTRASVDEQAVLVGLDENSQPSL